MAPDLIKRIVRSSIRRFNEWLTEPTSSDSHSQSTDAYPWLNAVLINLLKENDGLRPHYTWGLLHSAYLARSLGLPRISTIEFGVAGGNGLIALEKSRSSNREYLWNKHRHIWF